ncbi:MAG: CoB--CoM heterodisulfide reductase iron-sulfur subunit A family protein [Methanomassiliicoccales archaeon]|nr:MAG: CoB--CoM heterodisulfide reductase iron-sulfur subunit A family protein [Methanomassiliicoccales archaeon]
MIPPSPDGPHAPLSPPKGVAVFLCGCKGDVARRIDLEALKEDMLMFQHVRSAEVLENCCEGEDKDRMRLSLLSGEVDRFIVAGCSYKISIGRFKRLATEAGLDRSLVEVCNIKEHSALVHGVPEATAKAKMMLRGSLRRCMMLQPTPSSRNKKVNSSILIIGNGNSAKVASREAVALGHEVTLICPSERLGDEGHDDEVVSLEEDGFEAFCRKAGRSFAISTSSEVISAEGGLGDLQIRVGTPLGEVALTAGAVIVAMDEVPMDNPLRSKIKGNVIDQRQLEEMLRSGNRPNGTVVMLAMDDAGESAFDPLSTHEAVHNALYLKSMAPRTVVYIITREVFALGQCEHGYRRAQELGVIIIRTDSMPDMTVEGKMLVRDVGLGGTLEIDHDMVVIDNITKVPDMHGTARALGLPLDDNGRLRRPNAKLKPSSSLKEGVFICGTAVERSLGIGPSLEARSAVAKASALLAGDILDEGEKAEVWQEKCSGCLTCARVCPYGAPSIGPEGKAMIEESRCQGCGICASACPSKAIQLSSFRDDQIEEQIKASIGGI